MRAFAYPTSRAHSTNIRRKNSVTALSRTLTEVVWTAIGGDPKAADAVAFTGSGSLPSVFPVTDLASASIAAAGLALAELVGHASGTMPAVAVDRRLRSMWFKAST